MIGTADLKVGHLVMEFLTPGIGHLLRNAGCDFVIFDMEHSGFDLETIKRGVRYAEAAGLPAVVRTPSSNVDHIARILDIGAEGIMVPMVEDADHAGRIVAAARYAPQGRRGVASGIAHDRYRRPTGSLAEHLAAVNDRTTVFLIIESEAGLRNVDAIAAVEGVDCVFAGHVDLSCSLGLPGDLGHPVMKESVSTIVAAAQRNGRSIGAVGGDARQGAGLYQAGFDFVLYGSDIGLYQQALGEGVHGFRSAANR
jgi:2-dehydro-3-deoxyglucarate aldolase/4-hydroxy-2-oxoheptanedioate aldolase